MSKDRKLSDVKLVGTEKVSRAPEAKIVGKSGGQDRWAVAKVDRAKEEVKLMREILPGGTFCAGDKVEMGDGYALRLDGVSPTGVAIYSISDGTTTLGSFPVIAGNAVTIPYLPSGMNRYVFVHASNVEANLVGHSVGDELKTLKNGVQEGNKITYPTLEGEKLTEISISAENED